MAALQEGWRDFHGPLQLHGKNGGSLLAYRSFAFFFIEAGIRMKNGKSCIDKKNVSLQPYTKDVKYCQIKNIDFGSATRKFNTNMMKKSKKQKIINVPEPTEKEINNFYENIHNAGESPAILSIVEPFNSKFITDNTTKVLTNLY